MNTAPEDFEALRRLLAWKRHEQPPPGFFRDFADHVMARIEAGERCEEAGWWERWFVRFEIRPALAGAFGLAVIGLYFFGLGLSAYEDREADRTAVPVVQPWRPVAAGPLPSLAGGEPHQRLTDMNDSLAPSSMNPLLSAGAPRGLFTPGVGLRAPVERADFSVR